MPPVARKPTTVPLRKAWHVRLAPGTGCTNQGPHHTTGTVEEPRASFKCQKRSTSYGRREAGDLGGGVNLQLLLRMKSEESQRLLGPSTQNPMPLLPAQVHGWN